MINETIAKKIKMKKRKKRAILITGYRRSNLARPAARAVEYSPLSPAAKGALKQCVQPEPFSATGLVGLVPGLPVCFCIYFFLKGEITLLVMPQLDYFHSSLFWYIIHTGS